MNTEKKAGRPSKFGVPTVTIRVPVHRKQEILEYLQYVSENDRDILEGLKNKTIEVNNLLEALKQQVKQGK